MSKKIISSQFQCPPLAAKSLSQLLYRSLNCLSERTSIIDAKLDRKWTRGQVLDSALNFSSFLRNECLIKSGDLVLFVADNCDIHAIAIIGVLFAGGVYSSVPFHSKAREIQELVSLLNPKLLVSSLSSLENSLFAKKLISIQKIEKSFEIKRKKDFIFDSKLESLVTLVLTSGSSGLPKAVKRTNENILSTLAMFSHPEMQPFTEEDIVLPPGFCHICGQKQLFSAIASGAQLLVVSRDENHVDIFEAIGKYGVTSAVLNPTHLNFLIKNNYPKEKIKTLEDVMTGSAPLQRQTHQLIEEMFGFKKFRNSYGMSESGFALMVPLSARREIPNEETVGQVVPGFQVKVIDFNGKALGANQKGEICLKGSQVMKEYLNSKKENLFTFDGFLRSGDLGFYDSNHFFFVVSRIKDIIKCDGVSVVPSELEQLLMQHKDVTNAAVIGVEDEQRGQAPMAFVTLVSDSNSSEETINEWINEKLNEYKKIREIRVLNEMPKTSSGKIRKSLLSDNYFN